MSSEPPVEREVSAGGLVVREGQVVVIRPAGRNTLALPKGRIDPGETPEVTAAREIQEETAITGELIEKLGDVRYWYQRDGRRISKLVHFFLFRHLAGEPTPDGREIAEARWMPLEDAVTALSFKGEREMAERALSRSAADR